MPWGSGPNGGFTSGRPWLRMAPDVETRSVAIQAADASSVLATYRRLIWLRRTHPALQVGAYRRLDTESRDLFAYERATDSETIVVVVNFGTTPARFRVRTGRTWTVVFGTGKRAESSFACDSQLTIDPREAIILQAE